MKTRELGAIALGLVGLHTLALPMTSDEVSRSLGHGKSKVSDCGCGSAEKAKELLASGLSLQELSAIDVGSGSGGGIGGGPSPLIPQCPTGSPCTSQNWTWYFCLKVNNNPLQCQLWSRQFIRWFCPGINCHCCTGDWTMEEESCSSEGLSCTSGSADTLPGGCTPPIPNSNLCAGC